MDSLMNSKFMQSLQKFGQDLGRNKFISGLQAGMMSLVGILMVSAVFQILQSVLGPTMLKVLSTTDSWYQWLNLPYQFTLNSVSLWVTMLVTYNYAKNIGMKNPIMSTMDALIIFLIIAAPITTTKAGTIMLDTTYLASQGMFVGFLVAFIVVQIEYFCQVKDIGIKMPDVVPGFLQDSFKSIVPFLFDIIVFLGLHIIIAVATAGKYTLVSGFIALLSYPLNALISVPGMFVLCAFALILWIFGIHGTLITMSVVLPVSLQAIAQNAALHAAGKPLIFSAAFLFAPIAVVGGTGNTWPLVLMGLKAKSEQIRAVSKVSLIPGWFGINEPVTFGMPVMYNPILAIPYILNPLVVMLCYLIGYKTGLLALPWIAIIAQLPIGFGDYLGTLSWVNPIFDYCMIIVAGIIWYPFFKAYDNQLYKQEQAKAQAEAQA